VGLCAIGIDIGGTKVAAALVTPAGELHCRTVFPTASAHGRDELLGRLAEVIAQLRAQAPALGLSLVGVGVSTTGHIDSRQGLVLYSGLVPGWTGTPVRWHLEERCELPVVVLNDGHALALAEHQLGAARGFDHVLCVAVGTGVGGGLILDGRLYQGARGLAGLLGHTVLDHRGRRCSCGKIGCLEAYAAGLRIEQEYRRLARLPARRRMPLEQVALLARAGDTAALEAIRRGAYALGAGIASLANALNPQAIVIGGGVAAIGPLWFEPLRETILARVRHTIGEGLQVLPAQLGPDAGLAGAGLAALDRGTVPGK
jgi:glucokinase